VTPQRKTAVRELLSYVWDEYTALQEAVKSDRALRRAEPIGVAPQPTRTRKRRTSKAKTLEPTVWQVGFVPSGLTREIIDGRVPGFGETRFRELYSRAAAEVATTPAGSGILANLGALVSARDDYLSEAVDLSEPIDPHAAHPGAEAVAKALFDAVRVLELNLPAVESADTRPTAVVNEQKQRRPHDNANAAVLDAIQKSGGEAAGWTCREFAARTGFSKSTIVETAAWKELSMLRDKNRAERARDRRGRSVPRRAIHGGPD